MIPSISQYQRARLAEKANNLANRPIIEANREIACKNAGLPRNAKIKPLPKIPLEPHYDQVLKAESDARRALEKRTDAQWYKLVSKIKPDSLRNRIGCFVWWDYVGQTPWPKFQKFIDAPVEHHKDDEIEVALVGIGYTPTMAFERPRFEGKEKE